MFHCLISDAFITQLTENLDLQTLPVWLFFQYFTVRPYNFHVQAFLMVPLLALHCMSPARATSSALLYQCVIHPRNTYSHSLTLGVESAVGSEDTTGNGYKYVYFCECVCVCRHYLCVSKCVFLRVWVWEFNTYC